MVTHSNGFTVLGDIEQKWLALGGERGDLGKPRSNEIALDDQVGQIQLFEGAWICWHRDIGPKIIKGAIAARWEELGRNHFGYPTTDEMPAVNGGRFNHFVSLTSDGRPERSIYWHNDTGVHEVIDEIRKKWAETGWDQGPLGYPCGPEITLDDETGKLQLFQNAWLCWHPDTGAHLLRGSIATQWEQLGRNHFGYPTTDESPAINGGWFNHFVCLAVAGRPERSIYGHPNTGAHGIIDEIRKKWAETGWDQGPLGYPCGPEEPGPENTRCQLFERGALSWRADRGAGVDWVRKRQSVSTPQGTALGGWVELDLHWTGEYVFRGHMHDSGALDYKFQIEAALVSANVVLLMRKVGSVEGTESISPARSFDWGETGTELQIREHWSELLHSSFRVSKAYEISGIAASLSDAVKGILSFLMQSQVLGPHVALAVLIGSELRGRADIPILGSNAFPAILGTAGTSFLMGPSFAIPIFVGSSIVTAALFDSREINDEEYDFAKCVFAGSLPTRDKIILTNVSGLGNSKFVVPNGDGRFLVNLTEEVFEFPGGPMRYCKSGDVPGQLFIHELTHVWQNVHTNFHPYMMCRFIGTQIVEGDGAYYLPRSDIPLWEIGTEALATLVEEWFRRHSSVEISPSERRASWSNVHNLRSTLDNPAAVADEYYHIIAEMRAAI